MNCVNTDCLIILTIRLPLNCLFAITSLCTSLISIVSKFLPHVESMLGRGYDLSHDFRYYLTLCKFIQHANIDFILIIPF